MGLRSLEHLADSFTSQFVSGHGLFNGRRHEIGLAESSACLLCGGPYDTPGHALFRCRALNAIRSRTLWAIGLRSVADIPVLEDPSTHELFKLFCKVHHTRKHEAIFGTRQL